jgi:membrane fusion protein, multidrug efflux system
MLFWLRKAREVIASMRQSVSSGRRWRTALILLAGIAAIAGSGGCRSKAGPAVFAPDVTVARPRVQNVTDYLTFTGNTAASDSVRLVARVEGYLDKIHFTDGARVKKGDRLFTIQQEPYRAQLEQAEAQLAAQKAALWHAKTELVRYSHLFTEDAATQTQVDHWQYERDSSAAGVRSAEAQVRISKLNLSYTDIRAPFDGQMGRHLVDTGNLVGAMGQLTPLAEIDKLSPLYIYFTIDERDLLRVAASRKDQPHRRLYKQSVPVYIGVMNEEGYPREGRLDFASLSVSPTTGTLQLRATLENRDMGLLPGLFVRIRVPEALRHNALLVPGDAVGFDQLGQYVLVVNAKNVVERRTVKTGVQVGDDLVIDQGLKAGDWVITEGRLQAIPGGEVTPHRTTLPPPSASKDAGAEG